MDWTSLPENQKPIWLKKAAAILTAFLLLTAQVLASSLFCIIFFHFRQGLYPCCFWQLWKCCCFPFPYAILNTDVCSLSLVFVLFIMQSLQWITLAPNICITLIKTELFPSLPFIYKSVIMTVSGSYQRIRLETAGNIQDKSVIRDCEIQQFTSLLDKAALAGLYNKEPIPSFRESHH